MDVGAKGAVQGGSGALWMVVTSLNLRTWEERQLDFHVLPARCHNADIQFRESEEAGFCDGDVVSTIGKENF